MPSRLYSDNQLHNYYSDYIKYEKSLFKFAQDNNLSYRTLNRGFNKLKLPLIPQSVVRRKYPINEKFFDKIDTEEKAYYLGLLYADGNNNIKNNRVQIELHKKDNDILIKMSKAILNGHDNVRYYFRTNGFKKYHSAQLYLINNHLSNKLADFGCVENKTFKITFPKWLSEDLINHFVRGYFDGDGCLSIYERAINKNNTIYKNAEFNIVSTSNFVNELGNIFNSMSIPTTITKRHKNRNTNTRTLRVHGNLNIRKACNWLYKDATVYLDRKFKKYMELCEITPKFPHRSNYVIPKS